MKNLIFKAFALAGLAMVFMAFSPSNNLVNISNASSRSVVSKEITKTKTYKIRFGLLSKSGAKILSGNYDVGSFIATNNATGEVFDTYYGGGFQSLPAYYEGISEGDYTFSAMQGQGGWVGYGSVVRTVSDAQVDADGYVTIYIPITWEE